MNKKPMNKKLIITLTVLGCVSYFGSNMNADMTQSIPERIPAKATLTIKKTAVESLQAKTQEVTQGPVEKEPTTLKKMPKKNRPYLTFSHSALPKGFQFARNVFALKDSEFISSMGEIIEQRNGFVFFKSDIKPENSTTVVVGDKDNKLFIISSVLKIENINEDLRSALVAKGIEEHYYSEDLKIMYVQSTQEEVLQLHRELESMKLHPQVEIVRAYHLPR